MEMEKDENFRWWFYSARNIARGGVLGTPDLERYWFNQVTTRHELHPVIKYIIDVACIRPADWHQLLLEWPAVSIEDESQIAYTRDEAKGKAEVRTRTSVGKYLSRHWPHVPDHIRRDWAGRFVPASYKIEKTKEGIIAGIELGPRSCMQSGHGIIPFTPDDRELLLAFMDNKPTQLSVPWDKHPYAVYDPAFGWGMAIRYDAGKPNIVLGRALVWQDPDKPERKGFVRSYSRSPHGDDANSGSDEKLEAWLRDKGYEDLGCWPDGAKLRRIRHPFDAADFMVPYIDGITQRVAAEEDHLIIDDGGAFECTNTDGTYDSNDDAVMGECERCGDDVMENDDERIWAGRSEDLLICGCCARNEYTYVTGTRNCNGSTHYYIRSTDVVEVNGEHYDSENLPSDIVMLEDGDVCHYDDAVLIDDEYYHIDDQRIVRCADDEYRLKDYCWQCEHSGKWYSDDENGVELHGKYHPDSLREIADENE